MTGTVVPLAPPVVADGGNVAAATPRWLPWLFLALLVLPFHPYWLDFEQVRRGLLLVAAGLGTALTIGRWARPDARLYLLAAAAAWPMLGSFASGAFDRVDPETTVYVVALVTCARIATAIPWPAWSPALTTVLLATSLFGLLQRLGIAEFCGYGAVGEPVSVFGNLNVAAEVTCVGMGACLALGLARPRLALAALAVGGAYLPIAGARSSLVALPLAAAWLLFAVPAATRRKAALLAAVVLGIAAGFALDASGPAPFRAVEPAAQPLVASRNVNTIEVRREIAASCLAMIAEAPLFGRGIGSFAIDYPRYRRPREIELSTFDRQFAACPQTAHDDWLQLAVEGGVPALLLWLAAFAAMARAAWRDRARLTPLLALLALMAVRAPLWNAPCAAIALLFAFAAPSVAPPVLSPRHRVVRRVVGLGIGTLLIVFGLQPLLVNQLAAAYQASRARGGAPDLAALERASANWFVQPKVEQLLAAEYLDRDRAAPAPADRTHRDALAAITRALAVRPNDPALHLRHAEILVARGELDACKQALQRAAALDAGDPQLQLQLASLAFLQGQHDVAVRLLYQQPHWRLFEKLADTFDEFARLAGKDAGAERRYRAEACLRRALDSTGGAAAAALASERFRLAKDACAQAAMPKDPRFLALVALLALDTDRAENAEQAAAVLRATPLEPWQVTALGVDAHGEPRADRLRRLPGWVPLLPKAQ